MHPPATPPATPPRDSAAQLLRETLATGLDAWIACLGLGAACARLLDQPGGTR